MPVGIEQRDDDDDHVLQNGECARIGRGGERVQQLVGGLRGADLRRVNAGAYRDNRFLRCRKTLRVIRRQRARIGQPHVRGANRLEIADVVGGADDGGNRAMTFGGRSEIDDAHPVGLRSDQLEILLDAFRRDELPVGAHLKTEMVPG